FEPYPPHAVYLRQRFLTHSNVKIFQMALGDRNERMGLHIAQDPRTGQEYDYYHSLVSFEDTREIHWGQTIPVQCQTLGSLVDDKQIPAQVGILKVDTEGNDYAVIQGMGTLQCDVIMVEYWEKLPDVIGTCPWRLADMVAMLAGRSYSNFIFVKHNGPT